MYVPSTTRSARAKPASRSPWLISNRLQAAADSSGSRTAGSGSVRRRIAVARRAGERRVRRGDEGHGLRDVPDLVGDERGLVEGDGGDHVLARDVRRGDDHDPRPVEGRVEVDPQQARVRLGRAHRRTVPRPGDDEVVREAGRAGQLLDALAPEGIAGRPESGRSTASVTMLTPRGSAAPPGPATAGWPPRGRPFARGPGAAASARQRAVAAAPVLSSRRRLGKRASVAITASNSRESMHSPILCTFCSMPTPMPIIGG